MYVEGTFIIIWFLQRYESHTCDPDQCLFLWRWFGGNFAPWCHCKCKSLFPRKPPWRLPCGFYLYIWENPLSRTRQQALRKRLRACLLCTALAHIYRSCLQLLIHWRVLSWSPESPWSRAGSGRHCGSSCPGVRWQLRCNCATQCCQVSVTLSSNALSYNDNFIFFGFEGAVLVCGR